MRVLLVDCYDSYTYNLYQLIGWVNGREAPLVVRNDDWSCLQPLLGLESLGALDADRPPTLSHAPVVDAIVLSPGPGRPERRDDLGIGQVLLRWQAVHGVPILGVCLGHQGIAWAYGGRVRHAQRVSHGEVMPVYWDAAVQCADGVAERLFHGMPAAGFRAVRYHSLVVDEKSLNESLIPLAWCDDPRTGERVLMALRHAHLPLFGVQFHVESVCTEYGAVVMRNFLEIAATRGKRLRATMPTNGRLPPKPAGTGIVAGHSSSPGRQRWTRLHRWVTAPAAVRSPPRLFERLLGGDATRAVFWLDSATATVQHPPPPESARWSYMGEVDRRCTVQAADGTFLDPLQSALDGVIVTDDDGLSGAPEGAEREPPPLYGGWVGWLDYEIKRECFDAPAAARHVPEDPFCGRLALATRMLALDHATDEVCIIAMAADGRAASHGDELSAARAWLVHAERALRQVEEEAGAAPQESAVIASAMPLTDALLSFRLERSHDEYVADIRKCLGQIRDGESYEICLTNRLRATVPNTATDTFDPLQHYLVLRQLNPAPFAAYIRFDVDTAICCSSPERFLRLHYGTRLESRPIKGTIRRGRTPSEDAQLRERLQHSGKDRAENLMIVDLVRNDLGRVCALGSVVVPRLMTIESYATVHQMVSTVCGQLPEASSGALAAVLRACFPMGSMTGAPKRRTMQIIDGLERSGRGVYSGSIGYVTVGGQSADWNVVIRTAVWHRPPREAAMEAADWQVVMGAGGAIVAGSDAEDEFQEMMLKAMALIRSVGVAVGAKSFQVLGAECAGAVNAQG